MVINVNIHFYEYENLDGDSFHSLHIVIFLFFFLTFNNLSTISTIQIFARYIHTCLVEVSKLRLKDLSFIRNKRLESSLKILFPFANRNAQLLNIALNLFRKFLSKSFRFSYDVTRYSELDESGNVSHNVRMLIFTAILQGIYISCQIFICLHRIS